MPKTRVDKAMDALRNELAQLRNDMDKRFALSMDELRNREAQSHALILQRLEEKIESGQAEINRTVTEKLEQMNTHWEVLLRGQQSRASLSDDEGFHECALSTHRNKVGNTNTQRFLLPRSDCPSFYGDNPLEWIRQCVSYCDLYQIPVAHRVQFATLQFHDKASEWYEGYLLAHDPPDWPTLCTCLTKRFRRSQSLNGLEELRNLSHTGTIELYMDNFEKVRSRILLENRSFTEQDFVDAFVSGLKPELKSLVKAFKPRSVEDAYEYALYMEESVACQLKSFKAPFRPIGFTSTSTSKGQYAPNSTSIHPQSFPSAAAKKAYFDELRALGKCFKCKEKYAPGHNCKVKLQMLLGIDSSDPQNDIPVIEPSSPQQDEPMDSLLLAEEATVSLHSSNLMSLNTMKFKGYIGHTPVYALIDTGSTHSFVDPIVLNSSCTLVQTLPLVVMVANGQKMVTDAKCVSLPFSIQGHNFVGDLRLLPIQGYDVILGVDWLSQLGTFKLNLEQQWLEFTKDNQQVKLQVQPEAATVSMCDTLNITKELLADNEVMMAHIWLCDSVDLSSSPINPAIQTVLEQFSELFEPKSTLPPSRPIDHQIVLQPNFQPVNLRPYRYTHYQRLELDKIIEELLSSAVIRPSTSPFASPALLVKKKDGSWRLCVDYRKLNSITIKNKYPIPIIDDLLDELHGAVIFSKIDLRSGYHQIRMLPADIHKTAFRMHEGHYEYQVMPFGLTNAPATFQALMNTIFKQFLRKFVLVFFYDILVYSCDLPTHLDHLSQVLQLLKDNELTTKLSKCEFGLSSLEYLGHIISANGVSTDPKKVQAMLTWPVPKTLKELRGFLGLTGYYRKFIRNYGIISRPLTTLLKKNGFHWNSEAQSAFELLKQALSTAPVLAMPDFNQPFLLETDACDSGLGAVLMQSGHPIAYFSKALGPKSLQLSTYEKEFMALLAAVCKWRHYLQGGPFVIKTDHISLKHLLEQKLTTTLQQKGLCKLLGLDYTIQYKKGSENRAADALSRKDHHASDATVHAITEIIPTWINDLQQSYIGDDWAKGILDLYSTGQPLGEGISVHHGIIRKGGRIYVGTNAAWREQMIKTLHDSSVGGHSGILGTYQRVKKLFYWSHLRQTVFQHVSSCEICQLNKGEHVATPGLLHPHPIPDGAWQVVCMDFVTGLPKVSGESVLMVVIDKLTKYCHLITLSHPYKAKDVAQSFLDNIYKLHGLPSKIITDRDPIFTSTFWTELMTKLGVQLNLSTSYHPQTDGQTERLNQCIESYLRCMTFQFPKQWVQWVPLAEWWYNTNFHTALKCTPFEALYGYPPPHLPMGSIPKSNNVAVNTMLADRHEALKKLKAHLTLAQERMVHFANKKRTERSFAIGDWVYLKLQPYRQVSLKSNSHCHKLSPRFYGPFEILEKIGKVAYKLNLPAGSMIHPVFQVSQLKKKIGDGGVLSPTLPLVGSEGQLKIEPIALLERRLVKKDNAPHVEVLVKWSNLSDEEITWEDYNLLKQRFPLQQLEDKLNSEGQAMSGSQLTALSVAVGMEGIEDGLIIKKMGRGTKQINGLTK